MKAKPFIAALLLSSSAALVHAAAQPDATTAQCQALAKRKLHQAMDAPTSSALTAS
jgi:hypothetical protein